MDELILARHGESEYSVRGAVNGDPAVAVALTEKGRAQSRRLGELLAGDAIELCVISEFGRVRETADLALAGRGIPVLVMPELNEPGFGVFEGGPLEEYRAWARSRGPLETVSGPRGESRAGIARRYVRAYRALLERGERVILVVAHGLTLRYLLNAIGGRTPTPTLEDVPYAEPFRLTAAEVANGVERLEAWCAAPAW